MADLDAILSGASAVASDTPETVTAEAAQATEATQENREQTGAEGDGGQKMVPHEALHAEKQKVKRYTEQIAEFDKKLTEQNTAWERRFEQLIGAVKPKPEEVAKPRPEIWDNPDEFVQSGVQAVLTPFQTELQKTLHGIAKDAAIARHGDAVDAAEQAFMLAVQNRTVDAADFDKVLKAPNRYSAAVEWHKRSQAQAEIGDPVAFKEKLRAEILAELQGGNGQQQQAPAAAATVMPTDLAGTRNVGSRSGPAWSGPQSINDIFDRARKPKVA